MSSHVSCLGQYATVELQECVFGPAGYSGGQVQDPLDWRTSVEPGLGDLDFALYRIVSSVPALGAHFIFKISTR